MTKVGKTPDTFSTVEQPPVVNPPVDPPVAPPVDPPVVEPPVEPPVVEPPVDPPVVEPPVEEHKPFSFNHNDTKKDESND